LSELATQKFSSAAEPRHDGSDRNAENFGRIFVGKLFHVDEQNHGAVVRGDTIKRGQNLLVAEAFGDRLGGREVGFEKLLGLLDEGEAKKLAALVMDAVEEDAEEPRAAIGAGLETVEGFPGLQIGFLGSIFGACGVPRTGR